MLLTAQSPTAPAAPAPPPLSYTLGYLADKILTTKTGLEGECRQVTVPCADLKGSMQLLAIGPMKGARNP